MSIIQNEPTSISALSNQLGIVDKRGGVVTLDADFTVTGSTIAEVATKIHIGTGYPDNTGIVVLEMLDGSPQVYLGKKSDTYILAAARKVLSSADVNGATYETTATDITWHGGQ